MAFVWYNFFSFMQSTHLGSYYFHKVEENIMLIILYEKEQEEEEEVLVLKPLGETAVDENRAATDDLHARVLPPTLEIYPHPLKTNSRQSLDN